MRATGAGIVLIALAALGWAGCPASESTPADAGGTPDAGVNDPGPADPGAVADDTPATPDPGTPDPGPPDVPEPDVWPPPKGETVWLQHDDGAAAGAHQYTATPDAFYEYVRFEVEQPVRIWALEAQLRVVNASPVTLYVWDDFGGNFMNFLVDEPLATLETTLTAGDSEQWTTFELPEPIQLDPGRMFYAGIVVTGQDQPQLMVDAGLSGPEGETAGSLVWFSQEPPDEYGFPAVGAAAGDFMLRAEVEYIRVVPEPERDFEAVSPDELGIPGVSRLAMADVDLDGDLDVMTNGPKLYLNDGTGHFSDVSDTWLAGISGHNGGVFGDFDNDGDPDYFATAHGTADRLLRHDGDHYTDVTGTSGIDDTQWIACGEEEGDRHAPTEAAAWFDYDGDGDLDVYQANYECQPTAATKDFLWRNNGDGTFTDVTTSSGMSKGQSQAGRGVAPADANNDGMVDVLVTNYRLHKNLYFENQGGGLLKGRGYESQLQGDLDQGYYGHSIGAAWGDIDHDGDLDVFIANLAHPRFFAFSDLATMYLNPGTAEPVFSDVTEQMGIRYLETPSNPNLWDYDNDGDLDLFYTCVYERRTSQLYRNDGHPKWKEVTYPSGLAVYNGWGSAVGDIDGDRDLDLLAGNGGQYFRNRNRSGNGSIIVRVEGLGAGHTNRDGVGARVTAIIEGRLILRERFGAHGTGVQDSPWLHVGMGAQATADLEVSFPLSGTVVSVPGVPAGSSVHVVEDGTFEVE